MESNSSQYPGQGQIPTVGEDVPPSWAAGQYGQQPVAHMRARPTERAYLSRSASNSYGFQPSLQQIPATDVLCDFTNQDGYPMNDILFDADVGGSSSSFNNSDSNSTWRSDHSSSSFMEHSPIQVSSSSSNNTTAPLLKWQGRRHSNRSSTKRPSIANADHSMPLVTNYAMEQDAQFSSFVGHQNADENGMPSGNPMSDMVGLEQGTASVQLDRTISSRGRGRHAKRRRQSPSESPCHWLNYTLCSLWQRNHLGNLTLNDANLMNEAFGVSPNELHETWTILYGYGKAPRREATPRNFKSRYIDAFCSIWLLASLDACSPSEAQIDSLSQLLGATESEIQEWFKERVGTSGSKTPFDIEAEAIAKHQGNHRDCIDEAQAQEGNTTFQIPCRDQSKPFVCTTGCGESFGEFKKWKRHEEKNYWPALWCCTQKECPKRKANKHVFSRPDVFGTHISSCHPEVGEDTKDVVRRAKKTNFSQFPKECIFRQCEAHFNTWKARLEHLDSEFRERQWSPTDWRDYHSESDDLDDNSDASDDSSFDGDDWGDQSRDNFTNEGADKDNDGDHSRPPPNSKEEGPGGRAFFANNQLRKFQQAPVSSSDIASQGGKEGNDGDHSRHPPSSQQDESSDRAFPTRNPLQNIQQDPISFSNIASVATSESGSQSRGTSVFSGKDKDSDSALTVSSCSSVAELSLIEDDEDKIIPQTFALSNDPDSTISRSKSMESMLGSITIPSTIDTADPSEPDQDSPAETRRRWIRTHPYDAVALYNFVYEPLRSNRHIRLLQLTPNTSWKIYTVSLDNVPPYTVLSCTWSTDAATHTVTCNNGHLELPGNCYDALHHLQLADSFRVEQLVWVDAVCIDQESEDDRSQQVPLMSEIFQKAARAIVWLGNDTIKTGKKGVDKGKTISLVTFDNVIDPLSPNFTSSISSPQEDLNEICDRNDEATSDGVYPTTSKPQLKRIASTSSRSMLSLPLATQAQSFQFQMGYQCFAETAEEVSSYLQPQVVLPLGQSGSSTVERVSFGAGKHVFARKSIKLNSAPQPFFPQEAISMRRMRHPHIVHLILGYVEDNELKILMEPAADGNLQQYMLTLSRTKQYNDQDWKWFGCLVSGLIYMHNKGLRHRDIKPSNILLKDGEVYYADFGLSNDIQIDSSEDWLLGTFTRQYAAPEFATGQRSEASDIWSLGCVFIELLTVFCGHSIRNLYVVEPLEGSSTDTPRHNPSYYRNQEALRTWVKSLRKLLTPDKLPGRLMWKLRTIEATTSACEEMLKPNPRDRLTSYELAERLTLHSCCRCDNAPADNTNESVTSFLHRLHWNILNHVIKPQHHFSEPTQYMDLEALRSTITKLSSGTWRPQEWNTNKNSMGLITLDDARSSLAQPLHGLTLTTWKDFGKRIRTMHGPPETFLDDASDHEDDESLSNGFEMTKYSPRVDTNRFNCKSRASNIENLKGSSLTLLHMSLTKCSNSFKHNEQILIDTVLLFYRHLGWSVEESLHIAMYPLAWLGEDCHYSVDSIYSDSCAIRFDKSLRKVHKHLVDTREQKRPTVIHQKPSRTWVEKMFKHLAPSPGFRNRNLNNLQQLMQQVRPSSSRKSTPLLSTKASRPAVRRHLFRNTFYDGSRHAS